MAGQANERWLRLCHGRIPEQVGTFFEQLAHALTRGTTLGKNGIDLQAWGIGSGIEVKGGDDTHAVRIPHDQLLRHDGLSGGFPFSRFLYFLFRYENRLSHNGRTGLSRTRGAKQRSEYLFRRLRDLTVLDHRILLAIERGGEGSRSNVLPLDPERKCLSIPYGQLLKLFGTDWPAPLARLGLEPSAWVATERVLELVAEGGLAPMRRSLVIRTLLAEDLEASRIFRRGRRLTLHLPDLIL